MNAPPCKKVCRSFFAGMLPKPPCSKSARVEACFPEARASAVSLLEDPDEKNHTWVVLRVILPDDHPAELLRKQLQRHYETPLSDLPYHPYSFSLALHHGAVYNEATIAARKECG